MVNKVLYLLLTVLICHAVQVINQCREYDEMIADYEALTSDLLEWIKKTIETLNNREFPNSLTGVQNMLTQFNNYRNLEKPPKFVPFVESHWCFLGE